MKRIMIIVTVVFCILCIFVFLSIKLDPNRKLMLYEFKSIFKPTVSFNSQLNVDNIKEVRIRGDVTLQNTDEIDSYTDKSKLQKIIKYLNNISLVNASKDEMPRSPDVTIVFIDYNDKTVGCVWIYGDMFIEDRLNQKLYRSRKNITQGFEKIQF